MKTIDLWKEKIPILPGSKGTSKIAHIVVQQQSRGPKGEVCISSECRTPKEVEYWADYLIHELQAVKRKARKIYN